MNMVDIRRAYNIIKHRIFNKNTPPIGKTYYMLKWVNNSDGGAYKPNFKYTIPNKIIREAEWHITKGAKLYERGFHCSDLNFIDQYNRGNNNVLYVVECGGDYDGECCKTSFTHIKFIKEYEAINDNIELSECVDFITSDSELNIYVRHLASKGILYSNFEKLDSIHKKIFGYRGILPMIYSNYPHIHYNDILSLIRNDLLIPNFKKHIDHYRGTSLHRVLVLERNDPKVKGWIDKWIKCDKIEQGENELEVIKEVVQRADRGYPKTIKKYNNKTHKKHSKHNKHKRR